MQLFSGTKKCFLNDLPYYFFINKTIEKDVINNGFEQDSSYDNPFDNSILYKIKNDIFVYVDFFCPGV
jgi:hypothetical protein